MSRSAARFSDHILYSVEENAFQTPPGSQVSRRFSTIPGFLAGGFPFPQGEAIIALVPFDLILQRVLGVERLRETFQDTL